MEQAPISMITIEEIIRKSFKWVIPGLLKTIPNKVLSVKRSLVSEMTTLQIVPQPLSYRYFDAFICTIKTR